MMVCRDIIQYCKEYDGPLFHAVFCDPPYNLESISERYGSPNAAPPVDGDVFMRTARGFMNQEWDTDIAFQPDTWAGIGRLLHPGAFGIAASSTRTYHRMATAIENAGFIIHPMFAWYYKQGFPKATRLDTQIDRAAGQVQPKVGEKRHQQKFSAADFGYREKDNGFNSASRETFDITEPVTEMAKKWAGHRYGLQALRPMFEPFCFFQKRWGKNVKPWQSIVKTGAGALNIDGAWIETGDPYYRNNAVGQNGAFNASGGEVFSEGGHWPGNMAIDELIAAGMDEETANHFYITSWMYEQLEDADPGVFAAKASMSEREAGLDAMQRRLMVGEDDFEDSTIDDGREVVSDRPHQRGATKRRNIHATVKPLSLCRHLSSLLLPPPGYNSRLFVPFSGAGSEVIGAMLAGWDDVVGVELEEQHVKIADVRFEYWKQWRGMPDLTPKIVRDKKPKKGKDGQPSVEGVDQTTMF